MHSKAKIYIAGILLAGQCIVAGGPHTMHAVAALSINHECAAHHGPGSNGLHSQGCDHNHACHDDSMVRNRIPYRMSAERIMSVALEHDTRIQSDCIFCRLLSQTGEDSLERPGVATQTCHTESLNVIHKKRQGFPSNHWARGPPSA